MIIALLPGSKGSNEALGLVFMFVVNKLEVHVDEDGVEDERELVPVEVEGGVDEADEVVVGVLVDCGVVVGLG